MKESCRNLMYIYPLDDAVEKTRKFLNKILGSNDYQVTIEIDDRWYWAVFDFHMPIAEDFLKNRNMSLDEFYLLSEEDQENIVEEFKTKACQKYMDGELDFEFIWDEDTDRNWARWLKIRIRNNDGNLITDMNDEFSDIFGVDCHEY